MWKKGISGNERGRPKGGAVFRNALRFELEKASIGEKHVIARRLMEMVTQTEDGKLALEAIKVCLDRLYGKPDQQITANIQQSGEIQNTRTAIMELLKTDQGAAALKLFAAASTIKTHARD